MMEWWNGGMVEWWNGGMVGMFIPRRARSLSSLPFSTIPLRGITQGPATVDEKEDKAVKIFY